MVGAVLVAFVAFAPAAAARVDPPTVRAASGDADIPPGTLQALIDASPAGGVLVVPPGIYREAVRIHDPLTIQGPGAEIRGSDVWDEWLSTGGRWTSQERVPGFQTGGRCIEDRCDWPEQVFLDGEPLRQVRTDPEPGQFALDDARRVILRDDPTGRAVEVTVRSSWMEVDGPDVTVDGLTMRHAASPAQFGGLQARQGADRLWVRDVTLTDAHAALISFQDVTDASLTDSILERGGQLGVQSGGDGTTNLTISGNQVRDNNTEGFDPEWEAGGMKITQALGLRVTDNDVRDNRGPGIWCDIDCRDVVIADNRVTHNTGNGIMYEISQGAEILRNRVAENGWGNASWGWGAGILISSSSGATVRDNDLAWNADGITVVSQDRRDEGADRVRGTTVQGNRIFSDVSGGFMLAWLQDWDGAIYDPDSANVGLDNQFWHDRPEPTQCRFEWAGCKSDIASFSVTPGGKDSVYLTQPERNDVLASDDLPTTAEVHPVEPMRPRDLAILLVGLGGAGVIAMGCGLVILRRRRRLRIGG